MLRNTFLERALVPVAAIALLAAACADDETVTGPTTTNTTTTTTTGGSGGEAGMMGGGGTGGIGGMPQGGGGTADPCACTETAATATRGSAIAISPDDLTIVSVNRDVGTVTVARVDYGDGDPAFTPIGELPVGADEGSEPWSVAIDACGKCAYVALRRDQQVVRIEALDTSEPIVGPSLTTGSEPTAVALTPNGTLLYVANWVEGTLAAVDTSDLSIATVIDLNQTLLDTGLLGTSVANARPALAHPRAIAITNNGDADDTDETVLVTEWFAQRTAAEALATVDTDKAGLLYYLTVGDTSAAALQLPAVTTTGFVDHNGAATGCYPNQIGSVTVDGGFAYVTSTCDSPKGPLGVFTKHACIAGVTNCATATGQALSTCVNGLCTLGCPLNTGAECATVGGVCTGAPNFQCAPNATDVKTTTHPAMSIVDLGAMDATTQTLDALFDAPAVDSARMPLLPTDVGFKNNFAYVTGMGADGVFRHTISNGSIMTVGSATNDFIDMRPPMDTNIRMPIGIAVATNQAFAYVANEGTREITALELNAQAIAGDQSSDFRILQASMLPAANSPEEDILRGKRFFTTGLGRWSLAGEGWGSCAACHIDGLTDNVTWYFARGPRQSTSLDGSFATNDPNDQRILNWTAIFDEIADFELNTRGVSGGVGAIVSANSTPPVNADRINLLAETPRQQILEGSTEDVADPGGASAHPHSVLQDWNEIKAYIQSIRSPRAPIGLDTNDVTAGANIFSTAALGNCVGCHSGAKWTYSNVFYSPGDGPNANFQDPNPASLEVKAWNVNLNGFPAALFPANVASEQRMRFGAPPGAQQIQCVLRPVGTFNIAPAEVGILEVRENMSTPAQGAAANGNGFNPPSLLGVQVGAPFFHAGNARTLEELFDNMFAGHHQSAVAQVFTPNATDIRQLVAYLLSIDESTLAFPVVAKGATGGDLCFYP
jgi:DNA-binding beta-propeller fold protein YncE/mono/diheme cytochrome c family protein